MHRFFLTLLLSGVVASALGAVDPPPTRIMPLGDSNTQGYSVPVYFSGYRDALHAFLENAGYNVDFVGTLIDTQNSAIPDPDHEGHGGFRIDQINSALDGWLSRIDDPDVVLLMIGTNDFLQNFQTAQASARLDGLITHLAIARPYAKILVASIVPNSTNANVDAAQTAFNSTIPGIVNNHFAQGREVYFVNVHAGIIPAQHMSSDGIHPNEAGYDKIADIWADAIEAVIAPYGTDDPPAIARVEPVDFQHVAVTFSKPVENAAVNLANFSLNGSVLLTGASLDSLTSRVVTLTTTTLAQNTGYRLTVTGVRDRTPAHHTIEPGSTFDFTTATLANGSFEFDYAGWTPTGNQEIKAGAPYVPFSGRRIVAFNTGQSVPNGTLSQSFATTPGQTYRLQFAVGAVAFNHNQQRLYCMVQGSSTLLSQTVSVAGQGNGTTVWAPQSFTFTANSAMTTVFFQDVSLTSNSVDLLLDHVRVDLQVTRTLTVQSTPSNGVNVIVSPADNNGASSGATTFVRQYNNGTIAQLTAPANAAGNPFQKWQRNGVDFSGNTSISVTLDGDYVFTAVYVTAGPTVTSQPQSLTAPVGAAATFSATANGSEPLSYQWKMNGTPIGGANSLTYTLASVQQSHAGSYTIEVTNPAGSTTSSAAILTVVTSGVLANGSFESDYTGWSSSGNLVLFSDPPYSGTEGLQFIVFNASQSVPNGTLTQRITTTPGETYILQFDAGAFASNTQQQRLGVTVQGNTMLVSQVFTVSGPGNSTTRWAAGSYSFTADSPVTTVTFTDLSATTQNIDLILDNVRLTTTTVRTLAVESSGATSVSITVSPTDVNGAATGTTPFARTYGEGALVTLAAPSTASGTSFQKWLLDGVEFSTAASITVNVDDNHTYTAVYVAVVPFANGSFESDYSSWSASGDQFVYPSTAPYFATDGTKMVVFNGNGTATNGMLTQIFATTPGRTYAVGFDMGIVATNTNSQRLRVTVQGAATALLLNQTITTAGQGDNVSHWIPHSFLFTADSTITTLTFSDVSLTTQGVDLMLDHVRVTTAPFTNGSFESGVAPWSVTGNAARHASAPYVPTDGIWVMVFNSGQSTPNGIVSQTFATTPGVPYTLRFDMGVLAFNFNAQRMQVTVQGAGSPLINQTLSLTGLGSSGATRWTAQTFTFTPDSSLTTVTFRDVSTTSNSIDLLLDNVRVTGPATRTLNVGASPNVAVPITVSPPDVNDATNGITPFALTYSQGVVVNLTAPGSAAGGSFQKWQLNGTDYSTNPSISITVGANHALTAVYAGAAPFANGSFESDHASWTATGNQLVYSDPPYVPTNGTKLIVFNAFNATPDGVLRQNFATTPGQLYTLRFDMGVFANNTNVQRLRATVRGAAASPLVDQTLSMSGVNDGQSHWSAQSITFTADSAISILTFTDVSLVTQNIDLMLDHVRVTASVPRTLTVAASPNAPVGITVSPADMNGASNGVTQFTRTYLDGVEVQLTAPGTAGSTVFQKWQLNGADYATTPSVSLTVEAAHTLTAVYVAPPPFANGSFESDYTSWSHSGNQVVFADPPYMATDGTKMVIFNSSQTAPNGVLSQTFATTPGQLYALRFDMGVLAGNTNTQRLRVTVQGGAPTPLIDQTLTQTGVNDGQSHWTTHLYAFTADSAITTLTFADVSLVTQTIDLMLDHVRVTASIPRTLTVEASPSAPVSITVSPADMNGASNGATPFARTYAEGAAVNLTAPGIAGSSTFQKWQLNGVDYATNPSISVNLDGDNSLTAVYVEVPPFANGSFESDYASWSHSGNQVVFADPPYVATDGTKMVIFNAAQTAPNGVLSQTFATTPGRIYTLDFDMGVLAANTNAQRLRVTVQGAATNPLIDEVLSQTGVNDGQSRWTAHTYSFTADSGVTTLTFADLSLVTQSIDLLLDDVRVAVAIIPRTLTVDSSPASGVSILVSPTDANGAGNGITQFARTFDDGTMVNLTAAGSAAGAFFQKWQLNGGDYSTSAAISLTADANHSLTAVYITTPPFSNGSFESDFASWIASGNQHIVSGAPYAATEGVKLLAFNDGQSTPNGVVSQSFATTPGVLYTLRFDMGVLAFNTNAQRLRVTVQGSSQLLNQILSFNGLGGGAIRWVANTFTFTANSTVTTLTFADLSLTTQNIDLLLDNVRVTAPINRTLTVATSPTSSVPVVVSPADTNGAGNGVTQFVRSYIDGTVVNFSAPATAAGNFFQKWQLNGADYATTAAISVIADADHILTAVYSPVPIARTLTVATSPESATTIVVSPADTNGDANGVTQFTRAYTDGTVVNLSAPGTVGSDIFQKWQLNGADYATTPAISVTANANDTLTAVYTTSAPPLANGSFESNFVSWTPTGNQVIVASPSYPATDGVRLVRYNGGQATPNGVTTQTFGTTPGQVYRLQFDLGVQAFNTRQQRLQVTVLGGATLLSQTVVITGVGGGTFRWEPQSYTFTADSATTTLRFADVSTTSDSIDMLLDNVRVTALDVP